MNDLKHQHLVHKLNTRNDPGYVLMETLSEPLFYILTVAMFIPAVLLLVSIFQ